MLIIIDDTNNLREVGDFSEAYSHLLRTMAT